MSVAWNRRSDCSRAHPNNRHRGQKQRRSSRARRTPIHAGAATTTTTIRNNAHADAKRQRKEARPQRQRPSVAATTDARITRLQTVLPGRMGVRLKTHAPHAPRPAGFCFLCIKQQRVSLQQLPA